MLYTLELCSHIIMQRDVGRTCNVGCTEICGVSPTKNHREKTVDRWVINSEEDYGSSLSMAQEVILTKFVRSLCWSTTDGDDRSRL